MKIFYDTEFLEDGRTIDLISIGMVAEDGREYYAVNRNMPEQRIREHPWLMANVVPSLPKHPYGDPDSLFNSADPCVKHPKVIAREVAHFIQHTMHPELWAWYGAYDHVALCQLFGRMIDLPTGVPMWTNDLKQEVKRLRLVNIPKQEQGEHNALEDARHNAVIAKYVAQYEYR